MVYNETQQSWSDFGRKKADEYSKMKFDSFTTKLLDYFLFNSENGTNAIDLNIGDNISECKEKYSFKQSRQNTDYYCYDNFTYNLSGTLFSDLKVSMITIGVKNNIVIQKRIDIKPISSGKRFLLKLKSEIEEKFGINLKKIEQIKDLTFGVKLGSIGMTIEFVDNGLLFWKNSLSINISTV